MKILAIADRPPKESIRALLEREKNIELICTLGDLDYFSLEELKDIQDIPKIGVYGNHCTRGYFETLGIKNMHLTTFEYKGLTFGGFEGCVRYKEDHYAPMYTQEEASRMLNGFPRVDVMLCHCPPYGINDEEEVAHQGFKALRLYLEEMKPKYLLHGHTYPNEKTLVTEYKETKIVYVFSDSVIEVLW
jgi:Icc-related predicted phosphoesterase